MIRQLTRKSRIMNFEIVIIILELSFCKWLFTEICVCFTGCYVVFVCSIHSADGVLSVEWTSRKAPVLHLRVFNVWNVLWKLCIVSSGYSADIWPAPLRTELWTVVYLPGQFKGQLVSTNMYIITTNFYMWNIYLSSMKSATTKTSLIFLK